MAGNNLSGYTYYAFISYKREDEKWAKWLQKKLESYGFPVALRKDNPGLPTKIRPVFRDQSELSGGNLKEEIEKSLQGSKYLIVICSPRSAQSPWVSKEVQYFIDNNRENYIIPFIIGGSPNAKNPEDECFPEGLRQLSGEKEILGININEMGRDAAAIKVIARMFDLRFDTLWSRYTFDNKKEESCDSKPFCGLRSSCVTNHYMAHKPSFLSKLGLKIRKSIRNLFKGASTCEVRNAMVYENHNEISTCVYAPAEVQHNKAFIIRVYMYRPNEHDSVESKIREIDSTAVKKEYKSLDLPVKDGDKLTVQLDLSSGVECKTTHKTVIWRNHYTDCSFIAKLIDANQKSIEGTAYIYVNHVPAGEMLFTIDVVETKPSETYTEVNSRRFSKIFISYAHQDENQVRGIAEGCKMLGKDYFFDRHTLQPGDMFKDKILSYIDSADLFVLCWSKNAAESEWVRIEREHAL